MSQLTGAGDDTINFAIPGTAPHTSSLSSVLPSISVTLTIDGYTQLGSAPNARTPDEGGLTTVLAIEITPAVGTLTGLQLLTNARFTAKGLALHGFDNAVFDHNGGADSSTLTLYGNFIGTTFEGGALPGIGNSGCAVRTGVSMAQIGGVLPWQRHLLSGSACGVLAGNRVTVEGNLIGTDLTGTLSIPNGTIGNWAGIIVVGKRDIRIGGSDPNARNVISGNQPWGIAIWPTSGAGGGALDNVAIFGNYIGTD